MDEYSLRQEPRILVNFLGSSSSGKTTSAAILFAKLKELGIECEYLVEQAKLYLACLNVSSRGNVTLYPEDHERIFMTQLIAESTMGLYLPSGGILVSDSSPLNSFLYLEDDDIQHLVSQLGNYLKQPRLTFWCPGGENISKITMNVPNLNIIPLLGDPSKRAESVLSHLMGKLIGSTP